MSDILDQSEIDKLLSQATAPSQTRVYRSDGRKLDDAESAKIEPYDFRNPVFLTEVELRRLRLLNEEFIRYLSARLALFLRMEFSLKMSKLTTLTFSKFTESLPNPTHLSLFKVEPLNGVGVIDINPRLALTIVDRMLGGRGHSVKSERYLTEIEIALLEDIIRILLDEWCSQWHCDKFEELHPQIIGHENNGRFLQTSAKDAIILVLAMEADFGDCAETIQIGVPYFTIEPIVKALHAKKAKESEGGGRSVPASWKPIYEGIRLPARAQWEAFELSLREITHLRVGDIVELPSDIVDHTKLLLAGTPKFNCTVGLDNDNVVLKLNNKITDDDSSET